MVHAAGPMHGSCMPRELILLLAIYGPGVTYGRNEECGIKSCGMMKGVLF